LKYIGKIILAFDQVVTSFVPMQKQVMLLHFPTIDKHTTLMPIHHKTRTNRPTETSTHKTISLIKSLEQQLTSHR